MLTIKCRKHPRYQAKKEPKNDCYSCETLFRKLEKDPDLAYVLEDLILEQHDCAKEMMKSRPCPYHTSDSPDSLDKPCTCKKTKARR